MSKTTGQPRNCLRETIIFKDKCMRFFLIIEQFRLFILETNQQLYNKVKIVNMKEETPILI